MHRARTQARRRSVLEDRSRRSESRGDRRRTTFLSLRVVQGKTSRANKRKKCNDIQSAASAAQSRRQGEELSAPVFRGSAQCAETVCSKFLELKQQTTETAQTLSLSLRLRLTESLRLTDLFLCGRFGAHFSRGTNTSERAAAPAAFVYSRVPLRAARIWLSPWMMR